MVINIAELETVCGVTSKLPVNTMPEFAFAGRSNVGKSSLINAMVNRKALARTSAQPGKTQTINFFVLNRSFYFVDLPGYGYAKVTKELVAKWGQMIEKYLRTSRMLRFIFLLVDIRHEPTEDDKAMYDWIVYQGLRPIVIATKLDKIKRSQKEKQVAMIRAALGMEREDLLIPCSAETKQGLDELWKLMEDVLDAETPGQMIPVTREPENTMQPKPEPKKSAKAAGKPDAKKPAKAAGKPEPKKPAKATGKSEPKKPAKAAGKPDAKKPDAKKPAAKKPAGNAKPYGKKKTDPVKNRTRK